MITKREIQQNRTFLALLLRTNHTEDYDKAKSLVGKLSDKEVMDKAKKVSKAIDGKDFKTLDTIMETIMSLE